MTNRKQRIAIFYSSPELPIKDTDSELYTEQKEKFHFFLFHNQNLHFSQSTILKEVLLKNFSEIPPEFEYLTESNSLLLKKKIEEFDFEKFDRGVEVEFQDYLKKINYRIQCIFQTFTLFYDLYKEKHLIYVFPRQIYNSYLDVLKQNQIKNTEISKLHSTVRELDIMHWINYYTKSSNSVQSDGIDYKSIVKIEMLEKNG
ncbi:MAG: hypothetical protein MJB14_19890 [Spirochaetes bacterium]|nr:hypothetical protein [Spirochaetota bacterium]